MATVQVGSVWPTGSTLTITGQATTGQAITGATVGASFGVPTVTVKTIQVVPVGGVPSAQAFGAPTFVFAKQTVQVFGLGSAQRFGGPQTNQIVHIQGFYPYATYAPSITGQVICGDGHLVGGSGGTGSQFGHPTISSIVRVAVGGVPSAALFGQPQIVQVVRLAGVPSAQQFGTRFGWKISVWGVPSAQAFGKPRVFLVWIRGDACADLDLSPSTCIDLALAESACTDLDLVVSSPR